MGMPHFVSGERAVTSRDLRSEILLKILARLAALCEEFQSAKSRIFVRQRKIAAFVATPKIHFFGKSCGGPKKGVCTHEFFSKVEVFDFLTKTRQFI